MGGMRRMTNDALTLAEAQGVNDQIKFLLYPHQISSHFFSKNSNAALASAPVSLSNKSIKYVSHE